MRWLVCSLFLLAGCAHEQQGVKVEIQKEVVEVQRPCPVTKPDRPAPVGVLPGNARDALRIVTAKLLEYVGPGGYVERAEKAIGICTKPSP